MNCCICGQTLVSDPVRGGHYYLCPSGQILYDSNRRSWWAWQRGNGEETEWERITSTAAFSALTPHRTLSLLDRLFPPEVRR